MVLGPQKHRSFNLRRECRSRVTTVSKTPTGTPWTRDPPTSSERVSGGDKIVGGPPKGGTSVDETWESPLGTRVT